MDDLPFLYRDLMRSGAFPSAEDTSTIDGHISQREDELASVSTEIVQLLERLRQQTKRQAQLQRSIECYKSLFAPILRLPPELLSQVFVHCLGYYDDGTELIPGVRPSLYDTPSRLLRVSVGWRDIALKTPRLWANLVIHSDINPDLLNAWLARSGTRPLDITITDEEFTPLTCSPFQSMASSDLVSLCRRLRSLNVKFQESRSPLPQTFSLFPIDPVNMPLLEELRVCANNVDPMNFRLIPFASAPRLHRCGLHQWDGLSQHTPLPWSQLTHLTLSDQDNIFEIFRQCTNLINLTLIDCNLYSDERPTLSRPVLLPDLTALDIQSIRAVSGFTCLDLPSLQEFNMQDFFYGNLSFLLQQYGHQIIKFRWSYTGLGDPSPSEEVKRCFALMPQIKDLYIDEAHIFHILSEPLAENEHCLLPKLQSIHIGCEGHGYCIGDNLCDLADVVDFIKARWHPYEADSGSIREIYARPGESEAPSAQQLGFLRQCLDEGLVLRYDEFPKAFSDPNSRTKFHDAGEWPVRKRDEERGGEVFGWTYPCESEMD